MDLIFADTTKTDVGVIKNYLLDMEIGLVNTFELTVPSSDKRISDGYYLYMQGTEYGGVIDTVKIDTEKNKYMYDGRTWRGILASKIIEPTAGNNYYIVSGDANTVISALITKLDLTSIFNPITSPSGITITSYQFDRYTDGYSGISKMLSKYDAKLMLEWKNGKIDIYVDPIEDYSNESEIDSDQVHFLLSKTLRKPNHVIGLGSGDLSARTVIHRYLNNLGAIVTTKYYSGLDEITIVYDDANAESTDELISKSIDKLLESSISDKMEMTTYNIEADIGDKITGRDIDSEISMTQYVTKKIIKIDTGFVKTTYEIGDSII